MPVLDYGDRSLPDFEVTKDEDSLCVLAPLQRALESQFQHRKNVPHGLELRTDHGLSTPAKTAASSRSVGS